MTRHGSLLLVLALTLASGAIRSAHADETKPPRLAAVVTVYYHNSHADMLVGRLLEGLTLQNQPPYPKLQLASLYVDQFPANDKSRQLAARHGFRLSPTIADALTLGTDRLAVDGVLLIAEHGDYPESDTGQFVFPKRRMFGEIARVLATSDRRVPVFCDKHLADNWVDAKWLYDEAQRLKIPLMAGSSLPVLWRYPPVDVPRDARLREIVALSYHRLDSYGFHALELLQALAERRVGGETGVARVQYLEGPAVWEAASRGAYDRRLLDAALSRLRERPLPPDKKIEELVRAPQLFLFEYRDGLRAAVFTLNDFVLEWTAAWKTADPETIDSTLFWTQELRPFMHFSVQLQGIESLMRTGRAAWPAERTLLTSGMLDAALQSRKQGGRRLDTPELQIEYRSEWNWAQPPPPPPGRPITEP